MPNQLSYDFSDSLNYQTLNAEVSSGVGKCSLQSSTPTFNQSFASDTGITYNAALTEFVAGIMRQKFNPPAGATFFSNFDTIDGTWGNGSLLATVNGSPTPSVSGGLLDLTGATSRWVTYPGTGNADFTTTGTVRLKYRPNYSGAPAASRVIFALSPGGTGLNNALVLYHDNAAAMRISIYNSSGGIITSGFGLGTWIPVAGTTYEFELNLNFPGSQQRLFINGTQQGGTLTFTGTRTATITELRLGTGLTPGSSVPDCWYDEVAVFNTVQHTANYTPVAMPFPYQADNIVLPTVSDVLTTLTSFLTIDSGQARYTVNGNWWNGSAWVASSLVWAQANTQAEIAANLGTIVVPLINPVLRVHFQDSHYRSQVDNLALAYTSNKYIASRIIPYAPFYADNIVSVAADINVTGLDEIRFLLEVDGSWYYWTGSAWAISNLTKAQTNTLATFNTNIGTALATEAVCRIVIMLWPDPGTTTPDIDNLVVEYDFNFQNLPSPTTTVVYGFIFGPDGEAVDGATVQFKHESPLTSYREAEDTIVSKAIITATTDADGEFATDLVPGNYYFAAYKGTDFAILKKASGEKIVVNIPQVQEVNITDQIG